MGYRTHDNYDIGAATKEPFQEEKYRTCQIASKIMAKVPIHSGPSLLRAIRLQRENFIHSNVWQTLEVVMRGRQDGRKVTLYLHGDEPSKTHRITGEIEDFDKGWVLHEAGITLKDMPETWIAAIGAGRALADYIDVPELAERKITAISRENNLTRLHLTESPMVAGIPHIAEMF